MSSELALDLGTSVTRIADGDGVLVLEEPTIVAVDEDSGKLLAFGRDALGVSPGSAGRVALRRPVRNGQLVDIDLAEVVLAEALRRAGTSRLVHPRVLVCSHVGATRVQRQAFDRALHRAGAKQVRFLEQPVAVAIGAGLEIEEPAGTMIVDVGGGTTDVGVLALGGIVTCAASALGGEEFDAAVRNWLARRHGLVVDVQTAAEVRRSLATLEQDPPAARVEVTGRALSTGELASVVVSRAEVSSVVGELAAPLLDLAARCIVEAPPDVANDLLGAGLVLAGGGSRLAGLSGRLAAATGVPVHVAEQGGRTAVLGASRCLSMLDVLSSAVSAAPRR